MYTIFAFMQMNYFWIYTCKPSTVVSLGGELGIQETGWGKTFLFTYICMFFTKFLTMEIYSIIFPMCTSELLRPGSFSSFQDSTEAVQPIARTFMSCRGWKWLNASSCCFGLWLLTRKAWVLRSHCGVGGDSWTLCSSAQSSASWLWW